MADIHKNFSYSTVLTAPSPATSGASLVVQAGDGALFPAVPFNITIWPTATQPTAANAEIARVTAVSTDTFTITRAQESTNARTVVVGDQVAVSITNKVLTDAEPAEPKYFENIEGAVNVVSVVNATSFSKRPIITPFWLEGSFSALHQFKYYYSRGTGTSLNVTGAIAFYSLTNSTQLSLYGSESYAMSLTTSALWSGLREVNIQPTNISSLSFSEGLWYMGWYINGAADGTAVQNILLYGAQRGISAISGSIFTGTNNSSATNATNQLFPLQGSYSATLATNTPFPSTIGQSELTGGAGAGLAPTIYFQIIE